MNKLIKTFYQCLTEGVLRKEDNLTQTLIKEIEEAIIKRDLSLNAEIGELWQQIQDFREGV